MLTLFALDAAEILSSELDYSCLSLMFWWTFVERGADAAGQLFINCWATTLGGQTIIEALFLVSV